MYEKDVLGGGNKISKKSPCKIIFCWGKLQKNTTMKPNAHVPPPKTLNQFGLRALRRRWFMSNRSSKKHLAPQTKYGHPSLNETMDHSVPSGTHQWIERLCGMKKKQHIHMHTYSVCILPQSTCMRSVNAKSSYGLIKSYQLMHLLYIKIYNV